MPGIALSDGVHSYAADVTITRMMGFDPEKLAYLMEAGRFLGQADPSKIRSVAEDPGSVTSAFAPAPGFDNLRPA